MSSLAPIPNSKDVFSPTLFVGKVLFCTGGRSGICYKVTEAMMRHGADAVIVGRDAAGLEDSARRLEASTGRRCLAASADVRNVAQLEAAVASCQERFGRIDFVVCGAAGNLYVPPALPRPTPTPTPNTPHPNPTSPSPVTSSRRVISCLAPQAWRIIPSHAASDLAASLAPISGLSANAFKTVIDIDLLGTYNTLKATLPLVRASHGAYLHISATLHYRGMPYQAHVSAAKAGVDALSGVLAVEEGPRGVRSNVVAPGPIGGTVGMDRLTPKGHMPENVIPLGRKGDAEDIANAALFLFSPAASWITGTVLPVDGGEHHMRSFQLPYPQSLLDPESAKGLFKARM